MYLKTKSGGEMYLKTRNNYLKTKAEVECILKLNQQTFGASTSNTNNETTMHQQKPEHPAPSCALFLHPKASRGRTTTVRVV